MKYIIKVTFAMLLISMFSACNKDSKDQEMEEALPPVFVGTFRLSTQEYSNCSDASDNEVLIAESADFCDSDGTSETCLRELLIVEDDARFILRVITTTTSGGIRIGNPEDFGGTYTTTGRMMKACFTDGNCLTFELDATNKILTYEGKVDDCDLKLVYSLDD